MKKTQSKNVLAWALIAIIGGSFSLIIRQSLSLVSYPNEQVAAVSGVPVGAVSASIFPAGTIAEYPFNLDARDATANNNDLILSDNIDFSDEGIGGSAIGFDNGDGQSAKASSLSGLPISGQYSISFWFKIGDFNQSGGILSLFGNDLSIEYSSNHTLLINLKRSDGSYLTGVYKNVAAGWHHIVLINDGTNLIQYREGSFFGTSVLPSLAPHTGTSLTLGDKGRGAFSGMLDEVMVFNRVLSSTEISSLYQSQKNVLTSDPLVTTGCVVTASIKQNADNDFPYGGTDLKTTNGGYWPPIRVHEAGDGAKYILRTYDSSNSLIGEYDMDDDIPGPIVAEEFTPTGIINSPLDNTPVFPRYIVSNLPASPTINKVSIVANGVETVLNDQISYAPCP